MQSQCQWYQCFFILLIIFFSLQWHLSQTLLFIRHSLSSLFSSHASRASSLVCCVSSSFHTVDMHIYSSIQLSMQLDRYIALLLLFSLLSFRIEKRNWKVDKICGLSTKAKNASKESRYVPISHVFKTLSNWAALSYFRFLIHLCSQLISLQFSYLFEKDWFES